MHYARSFVRSWNFDIAITQYKLDLHRFEASSFTVLPPMPLSMLQLILLPVLADPSGG